MSHHSLEMFLAVQLRIVVQTELDSPFDDVQRVDVSVCFRHDATINGSRLVAGRGAMVFRGISHHGNLFLREPATQVLICSYDSGRGFVMMLTTLAKSRVMIGSNGINHVAIHIHTFG